MNLFLFKLTGTKIGFTSLGMVTITKEFLLTVCHCVGHVIMVFIYFSLTVKAATLIFISGCGSAISSAKEGKSGFIYNPVKS